jgi:hypothetical protein
MIARLPGHRTLTALLLERPLEPATWTSLPKSGSSSRQRGAAAVEAIANGLAPEDVGKGVYIQHRMDNLGRHEYIDILALVIMLRQGAADGMSPPIVREDVVKPMTAAGTALIYTAQPVQGMLLPTNRPAQSADDALLCPPMSLSANYSVCDDLTIGRTCRVVLVDEATLARGGQHMPPIFNHLALIVNCHQDSSAAQPGKYRVGAARPDVLYQPVHKLYGAHPDTVVSALRAIVERMWEALQSGSVAVHCLAGLHRAPAIVACFYLYRVHVLGHRHLPSDVTEIYRRIREVRPSVAPLGYIELIRCFEAALLRGQDDGTAVVGR